MIVIPMAGLSSRFTRAGYDRPKYMLPLGEQTVFDHAISGFSALFETVPFLFIARSVNDTEAFIKAATARMKIADVRVVILDRETSGQAETVELGIRAANIDADTPLTIFNIDTFRRDFTFPEAPWFAHSDGYLEVFRGEGANWSYVKPGEETHEPIALETAEKKPISDLCCDGLYHFARADDFLRALECERASPSAPELYVAPLYNHLIQEGKRIHYDLVAADVITFCGVPSEYEALLKA
ncbi:dTDP-glucose pyrophosphorylase [Neokomagataea thailandica NBRC 106555]|uniref:Capsular biosynthesis protein n=2 Tax=Neokomagataea TaxID=1223423 RepID=A0A4Y6V7W6_9PROT|nr:MULTISPECIES: glycosyltransferase family 2 protein [Neokomagataea]QDH24607.1 capsular biosynthesis protein [Neokomagataea tanensis]GBR54929.1 dTDP-glucose pyrophosphorylase [Neokomagataea thailandica NBRC 106555]